MAAGSSSDYTIVSTTCGTSLAPSATCTASVKFTPSTAATKTATLRATSSTYSINQDYALTGVGVDTSLRAVLGSSTASLTGHLIGSTSFQDVTVTNNATSGTTTGLNIAAPSSGTPWSIDAGNTTCIGTLGVSSSCSFRLAYSPVATGATNGTVTVSATNMLGNKTLTYSGSALKITGSTASVDLGIVNINTAKTFTTPVVITNPSALDSASSCTLTVPAPYTATGSTCGASLAASQTCSFQITLPAQASAGVINNTATYSCGVGGSVSIALAADVELIPNLVWAGAPSPAFGNVDIDKPAVTKTFTLQNSGSTSATLTGLSLIASSSFAIVGAGTTCTSTTTLAASATCNVVVSFHSASDTTGAGGESAILRAQTSVPVAVNFDLNMTGTGTTMSLAFSPNSLAFTTREVGQAGSEVKTSTLTNNGTRAAALTYSSITSPPFTKSGGTTCGAALAAGANCLIEVTSIADASAALDSQTLTVTETYNTQTHTAALGLTGQTKGTPTPQLKDDKGNSTFSTTITTTDITGPTDNASNIIDLSPTNRDVVYTFENTTAATTNLNNFVFTLTKTAGAAGTMAIQSDNCTGNSLAAGATCTFKVRYTPTTNNETSTYTLSVATTSVDSGASYSTSVTNIIGHSLRSAVIGVVMSPTSFPLIAAAATTPVTVSLTNNGDQSATGLAYAIATGDTANFSKVNGGSPCGTSLAAGVTCNFTVTFAPGNFGRGFTTNFNVTGTQTNANQTLALKAASFLDFNNTGGNAPLGSDREGMESEITADSSRFYIVSRRDPTFSSTYDLFLNVCSKATGGGIDPSTCISKNLSTTFGSAGNFAGDLAGSGPRITQSGNKILIAIQNKDVTIGGSSPGGGSTLVICQKPSSGNTIADVSCAKSYLDSTDKSGQFGSITATATQVFVANTDSTNQLVIYACNFDSTTTSLATSNCQPAQVVSGANQGIYPSISYNGSQILISSYDSAAPGLRFSACSFNAGNVLSNCTTTLADSSATVGIYPSMVFDGTKAYAVSQLGTAFPTARQLQLTYCDVSGTNAFTNCTSQTVNSTQGTGTTPKLFLKGNSTSGRLWISANNITAANGNSNNTGMVTLYKCDLPLSAASCTSQTPYFSQPIPTRYGKGLFYSRSLFVDIASQVAVTAYDFWDSPATLIERIGLINIGLLPEM